MQFCFDNISGYTKTLIKAGADVICVRGNVPGGFRKTAIENAGC